MTVSAHCSKSSCRLYPSHSVPLVCLQEEFGILMSLLLCSQSLNFAVLDITNLFLMVDPPKVCRSHPHPPFSPLKNARMWLFSICGKPSLSSFLAKALNFRVSILPENSLACALDADQFLFPRLLIWFQIEKLIGGNRRAPWAWCLAAKRRGCKCFLKQEKFWSFSEWRNLF